MRKAFKSSVVFDQQVVSRDTMPTAMLETYQTCDKPPPLDKLNSYRLVIDNLYNMYVVAVELGVF
jgi:WAS family protein